MNGVTSGRAPDDLAFHLIEQSASSIAGRTDALFVAMLALCGLMAVVLCVLVLWFCVHYRKGSNADRTHPPSHAYGLEAAWTALPMLLFLGLFVWSAYDNVQAHKVPANALPVYVVAKQWMWKLQHGNGRREINELHVPVNQPVVLVMASQDVIHSFFVPAFRVKQDVVPGRYTRLWFTATRVGDYRIECSEYCGSEHSAMLGHVRVMEPAAYARWLASPVAAAGAADVAADTTPQQRGAALFRQYACASCHDAGSSVHAPPLGGLYGRTVRLADGRRVRADDNYLRESIVAPKSAVVAGQPDVMPSLRGQLDEAQLQDLVAYLRSLPATAQEAPR